MARFRVTAYATQVMSHRWRDTVVAISVGVAALLQSPGFLALLSYWWIN